MLYCSQFSGQISTARLGEMESTAAEVAAPREPASLSAQAEAAPSELVSLSAAERARMERQRLRARELRAARLADVSSKAISVEGGAGARAVMAGGARLLDTGGGFLLPADEPPAELPPAPAPPAPPPLRCEWPVCRQCGERFPTSHLLETFGWAACDRCRDDEGDHALVTRTEAKAEFLLQDCDLDQRGGPLPCVRRRNPHRARAHDMRLYLRAAVEERAYEAWGGAAGLADERARRDQRKEAARTKKYARELKTLRLEARGVARGDGGPHEHAWGAERGAGDGEYSRVCTLCGLEQTYEKM